MDGFAKFLDAVAHILGALAWPALVAWIAWFFRISIKRLLRNLGELSIKAGPIEATAKTRDKVGAVLGVAEVKNEITASAPAVTREATTMITAVVDRSISDLSLQRARSAMILWVDDNPENNVIEKSAFEAVGINVVIARTTNEAKVFNVFDDFKVIISDMSRPPDNSAGYTLLEQLGPNHPPYIIYSSSDDPAHNAEAKSKGALASTSSASRLFELTMGAIVQSGKD